MRTFKQSFMAVADYIFLLISHVSFKTDILWFIYIAFCFWESSLNLSTLIKMLENKINNLEWDIMSLICERLFLKILLLT